MMRLDHILLAMSIKQLKELADLFEIHALPKRRDEAAAVIYSHYLSQDGFDTVWSRLSALEQQIYAISIVEMHNDGYVVGISRARLLAAVETGYGIHGDIAAPIVTRLHELGLFGYTQVWYIGDGYEVPAELATFAVRACVRMMQVSAPVAADEVRVLYAYGRMIARDAVRVAARVAGKPLPLTKQGTIYKREVARLKPFIRAHDSAGIQLAGLLEGIPFSLHLCMKVLEDAKALLMREGAASLHAADTIELLHATPEQWDNLVTGAAVNTLSFGHVYVFRIARALMDQLPPGQWFVLEDVLAQRLGDIGESERSWRLDMRHFVRVMALAGVLDVGLNAKHEEVVKVRPRVSDPLADSWVVQPSLDLLVPETAHPVLHFLAGQLGELQRADEMSSYRLTKPSVLQLCDRGWSGADILSALQAFSATPVAQGVQRTIRDWVAEYDKAVLWDVMLVRFATPALLEAFAADPRGQKALVERVGDCAAIVRRTAEKLTREVLSDIGAPAPQGLRKPTDELQSSESGSRKGDTKANQVALRKLLSPELIGIVQSEVRQESMQERA
ncbi:MAG: helicase-associated domain-containing protein [Firmicutes bacterium]|nr:helicase-associated domain-containing protein [Bacillota bacterium]